MNVSQLGEFPLIDRIQHLLPAPGPDVVVGIGDDVAVLQQKSGQDQVWLATVDVQMEGAHFLRRAVVPHDLGRKALAINLSDIAACGGTPRFALISLGLPDDLKVDFVDGLYAGLREEAQEFGVDLVGGNISRSPFGMFVDITLLGQARRGNVLLRSGAQVGDKILVTGTLGDAAAGVALLLNLEAKTTASYSQVAHNRFSLPIPRVREGLIIGATRQAHAMLDISDGLASDLQHICDQSHVGARVTAAQLPVARENRLLAQAVHNNEWHFALFGGEDYELLFTAPPENVDSLAEAILKETGTPITMVGEILTAASGSQLELTDGQIVPLEPHGWDHFKH